MKTILAAALLALTAFFGAQPLHAQNQSGPIVVELFTSQGCSSCPPADQAMNQLAQNPNFIALSYHVTYWDHIGWKDPLGRIFADSRQRNYSEYKQSRRIYTPQMIINGGKEFVGSRVNEANRKLGKARPIAPITISGATPKGTMITLPQLNNGDYTLWLAGVKAVHTEKIQRGENRGKNITYNNTVLSLKQAQKWDGNAQTLTIDLPKNSEIDYYVIFAQNRGYGEISAAGKIGI